MKKIATLRYFALADSMAPFSAVLELFASESPIFGFVHSGAQTRGRISEMGDRSLPNFRT